MNAFNIEDVPVQVIRKGRAPVYPFVALMVGQSFVVPKEKAEAARSAAYGWAARNKPIKLLCAKQDDGSMRIGRIA